MIALLLLHGWLALSAQRGKTNAVDELPHLTAGHALWSHGDYRLQPENGVLPQLWEGLPAAWRRRPLPPSDHEGWRVPNVWSLGHAYFHQIGNDLPALLREGRAMNTVWSAAVGLLVFFWTRRLFGGAGGWLALVFWAFCPTFLAHAALATSDMCMTFFMLASVGAYWRHLREFTLSSALLSSLLCALAFVAKYSAVLLPVMFAALALARLVDGQPLRRDGRSRLGLGAKAAALLGSAGLHLAVTALVIWAFHAFRFHPSPDPAVPATYTRPWAVVLQDLSPPLRAALAFAREHRLLPDAYLYGFGFVVDLSAMRGAFFRGETSFTGWRTFFPYAFLVKTPLPLLLALTGAAGLAVARWRRAVRTQIAQDLLRLAPLISLLVVYGCASIASTLNIGHRHLLPLYPVVFIATGAVGWAAARQGWRGAALCLALVVAQATASASVRPHYLAFFNRLAGGPSTGYRLLVDSSLDWGQDLPELAVWLRANGPPGVATHYAYFGTGDPEFFGIAGNAMVPLLRAPAVEHWRPLTPGVYCISATMLSQAYSNIREPWNARLEEEYQRTRALETLLLEYQDKPDAREQLERLLPPGDWRAAWRRFDQLRFARLCALLSRRDPDAQIGFSINIYRLSAADIDAATGDTGAFLAALEKGSESDGGR